MTDHAIVVGLDRYENPAWNLSAAVGDAVEFAHWVTEPSRGRATRETLTLLLSPREGATPDLRGLEYQVASKHNIGQALRRYIAGIGDDTVERLWFFYAGHAVSERTSAPDDPPVLVPPEVTDLDAYLDFEGPLALTKYLGLLQVKKPRTQIFFIDACRNIAQASRPFTVTNSIVWDLAKLGGGVAEAQARQAVLYAATVDESANELGASGIFSRALREGLRGRGPQLDHDNASDTRSLGFNALTSFMQRRVRTLVEDAIKKGKKIQVQEPTPSLLNAGDLVLERFDELPLAKLRVFVTPATARPTGKASIKTYLEHLGKFSLAEERTPLENPVSWELAPGPRTFQLSSPGFRSVTRTVELVDEIAVPVELEALANSFLESKSVTADPIPDSFREPLVRSGTRGLRSARVPGKGWLTIRTRDPLARVTVANAAGQIVHSGYGDLESESCGVGSYRASVTFPGLAAVERTFSIDEGEAELWDVRPEAKLSPQLTALLASAGVPMWNGLSKPSEAFGPVTLSRLGSLLAWAAWAARFPDTGHGKRLRSFALRPLPAADAAVQLLIGDVGGGDAFLNSVDVRFGPAGAEVSSPPEPVKRLSGVARELVCPLGPDAAGLVISARGLGSLKVPVPTIRGYVHVVIITAENDGTLDAQRFLMPIEPSAPEFSDYVRTAEVHARALAARTRFLPKEAEKAFEDPRLDPLTTALLGFRLANENRLDNVGAWRAALERVLAIAPELPDVHVLAALSASDPKTRDRNMERAAAAGVPLIADAYVAFAAWLEAHAAESGEPPPVAVHALVRSGAWSLLDSTRVGVDASRAALPAASLAKSKASWASRLEPVSDATVCIEQTTVGLVASAFYVAPGRLLTMSFALPSDAGQPLSPGATFAPGWLAARDGVRVPMRRLQALTAKGPPEMSERSIRLALVETEEMPVPYIRIDTCAPRVGQRVAVIAYNVLESLVTKKPGRDAAFAGLASGEKAVMPGEVTSIDDSGSSFTYDCWTLSGSAGGPVVNLETGAVLGIHYAGTPSSAKRKLGVGLPLSFLTREPLWAELQAFLETPRH